MGDEMCVILSNDFFSHDSNMGKISSFQTCAEALREANVAAAFGKPINF